MPAPALPEATSIICVFLILLVPFAIAGLALINTGLGRSHSAAHTMLASLCVFAVACGAYFICGFAWQGYIGMPAHTVRRVGKAMELDWGPTALPAPPGTERIGRFAGSDAGRCSAWLLRR